MGSRTYSYDVAMVLADGAAAYTASSVGQVSSAAKYLDLGGAPETGAELGATTTALARLDAVAIIDVSALATANTNDLYTVLLMGSNSSSGASPVVLGSLPLGNTSALPNGATTSVAGRYELLFCNEQADIIYEYIFAYLVVAGTSPSITPKIWVAPLPRE